MREYLTRNEAQLLIDWGDALKERESVKDLSEIVPDVEYYGDVIEYAYSKAFFVKNKISGDITLGADAEATLNFADDYQETIERLGWRESDER